jgi:hypothetical protein
MTLASRLTINGANDKDAIEVWEYSKTLIKARDDYQQNVSDYGRWGEIAAAWGQGYSSWMSVEFSLDGQPLGDWGVRNGYEPDPEDEELDPEGTVVMHYDTAYGYTGDNHASCSDLHSYLMKSVRDHFADRGWTFTWYNEYMGEWSEDFDHMFGDPERGKI